MAKAPTVLIRVRQLLEDHGHQFKAEHDGHSWAIVAQEATGRWALTEHWVLYFWHAGSVEEPREQWIDTRDLIEIAQIVHDTITEITRDAQTGTERSKRAQPCQGVSATPHAFRDFGRPAADGTIANAATWRECLACGVTETDEDYQRKIGR